MIRRTYLCENCEKEFVFVCGSDDPDPLCPNPDCDKVLDWVPRSFAIGGSIEGKAADETYRTLEKDYGLSDFKDNAKEGETGIIRRQETKVETEIVNQTMSEVAQQTAGASEAVRNFWGANAGNAVSLNSITGQQMVAMAKVGPETGIDPIRALHQVARDRRISRHPASMLSEGYRSDMKNPARKERKIEP